MPVLLFSPRSVLRQASDLARAVNVMRRRRLFDPLRPDDALLAALATRRYGMFAGVIRHAAHRTPQAPALVDERGQLSFGEVEAQANQLARGLAARGLKCGDVAGVLARDHRGWVLGMAAAGKLGMRTVLMNTGFAKPQFADVAAREKLQVLLHDSEFTELTTAVPAAIPRILTWVDASDEVDAETPTITSVSAGQSTRPLPAPARPSGLVILTSGTTGTPKGAPRDNVSPLISAQFLDRIPLPRNGTMVVAAPVFHATGLSQFVLGWAMGNRMIFQQRRFDPERTLANIAKYQADSMVVVPTMLQRMLDLPEEVRTSYDMSSLRTIFAAGSAIPADVVTRSLDYFRGSLYNVYGSTECAIITVATPEELHREPATAGRPPVGIRITLYDDNRRRITAPNVTGTIFISNPHSFHAYTDGRTKETVDGLMSTGDLGHLDEHGLLFIDGRDDDMIVSGGENVFPQEVEHLIADRPDVLEAAVVGVDDREFGKRLCAFVVPGPECTRDAAVIKEHVRANLARYKVPREVVFLDELPRNATGKLLRKKLIELQTPQE